MGCLGVLADDLTGAMDAGVQMTKRGYSVHIAFEPGDAAALIKGADMLIVDTESRNIPPDEACARVAAALRALAACGCTLSYKKIDSTLRGNIGAELRAVFDGAAADAVLVAPALPFNGRTTLEGVHYVGGVRLEDTELAKDPFSPVRLSAVAEIIARQYPCPGGLLDIACIRQGPQAVARRIRSLLNQGNRLIVADTIDDGDLQGIAAGCALCGDRLLLCGSAGLFQYLEQSGRLTVRAQAARPKVAARSKNAPVLILSGSPSAMSKEQIRRFAEENPQALVLCCDSAEYEGREQELEEEHARIRRAANEALACGRTVVVDTAGRGKENILYRCGGDRARLERESEQVLSLLTSVADAAVRQTPLRGLVLFGGDTALRVSRRLGAAGMRIIRELEPFIPLGVLIGGICEAVPVVTKSGGFGRKNSLLSIVRKLEQ